MNKKQRRDLIERAGEISLTLEGQKCSIGGWSNDAYATLAACFGGFWRVSWEAAERIINADGKFTADDVTLLSWRWLGVGVEVPERLRNWLEGGGDEYYHHD